MNMVEGLKLKNGNILIDTPTEGFVEIGPQKVKIWIPNEQGMNSGIRIGRIISRADDVNDPDLIVGRRVMITRFAGDRMELDNGQGQMVEYYVVTSGNIVATLDDELRAKGNNIFVKLTDEQISSSGILTNTSRRYGEAVKVKVHSIGPDVMDKEIRNADELTFFKNGGINIVLNNEKMMIIEESNVVGVNSLKGATANV